MHFLRSFLRNPGFDRIQPVFPSDIKLTLSSSPQIIYLLKHCISHFRLPPEIPVIHCIHKMQVMIYSLQMPEMSSASMHNSGMHNLQSVAVFSEVLNQQMHCNQQMLLSTVSSMPPVILHLSVRYICKMPLPRFSSMLTENQLLSNLRN